jgi:hypothetical protein
VFTLHEYAIGDVNGASVARIHTGSGEGVPPGSGYHAQGEFVWNLYNPSSGTLGWSCTASGTPGTWTVVPVAGFGGTYTGDAQFSGTLNATVALSSIAPGGYGFRAGAGSGIVYLDNQKPGTGFGYDITYRTGRAHEFHVSTAGDLSGSVELVGKFHANGLYLTTGRKLYIGNDQVVGPRGAALPPDATDLASAVTLINAMKARLIAHGLTA